MAFNSIPFFVFLAAVYAGFRLAPPRARTGLLLAVSAAFLAYASPASAALLLVCSLLNFFGALRLEKLEADPAGQRRLLGLLVLVQAATFAICKYSPLRALLAAVGKMAVTGRWEVAAFAIPLGFSFYFVQGIGYIIDVGWGKAAERSLPRFLLFMSFFPKVFLGPIERAGTLLPQLRLLSEARFDYDEFRGALLRFGWGLFKKVVIADRLALYVNEVYDHPGVYPGVVGVTATLFFAFQILADFSGYSDMALGIGNLFHLRLIQNFENPYGAPNIQEFWRRWHVSFTGWISAFIFTPLRMKLRRWGKPGLVLSIYATFVLVGIWHGNGVNFLCFGLLHGTYMAISILTLKAREARWTRLGWLGKPWFEALRVLVTFGLVVLSLVFFRAATFGSAMKMFASWAHPGGMAISIHDGLAGPELDIALAMIFVMFAGERLLHAPEQLEALLRRPLWIRWTLYFTLLLFVLCFGVFHDPAQFIYFRF